MAKRTSPIWNIDKQELQKMLDSSSSFVQILEHFGLGKYNGNHKTLYKRIKEDNLSLVKINKNRKMMQSKLFSVVLFLKKRNKSSIIIKNPHRQSPYITFFSITMQTHRLRII